MARKGLGKGLDSLIPEFYNEDFDINSPQSLEDMLNEKDNQENESSENANDNIFEQLEKEKKGLIEALKSGEQIQIQEEPKDEETIESLRKDLYGTPDKPMTNLEYISKTLKLRDKLIANGEKDPFLPHGSEYQENQADIDKANYVAKVYQECVDYADGDPQLFTNELMRRTANDSPLRNAKK